MRATSYLMVLIVFAALSVLEGAQAEPKTAAPKFTVRAAVDNVITESGVAGIQLGMTLDEARRASPTARFSRATDGDGVALVEVTRASGESLTISAGEEDPGAPIDWSKRIDTIEAFSAAFRTAEGVRVGALVRDVERVYGKTRIIIKSEIESREYVEFERQPAYLIFRLDYSGIFTNGRRTTQYQPAARLFSISVSSSRR